MIIEELQRELSKLPDRVVHEATFHDYVLQVRGSGWTLTSTSSWRVVRGGVLVCGAGQQSAPELIRQLLGKSIERVYAQSALLKADPVFELSDGTHLEIFSDQGLDPWTLSLPWMIFVGAAEE